MDTIAILHDFAKKHSIPKKEVEIFLNEFGQPKTMEEIEHLPHDMQTHYDYITVIPQPLRGFIEEELFFDRHQTITLDRIIECLYDHACSYVEADDYDDIDIQHFETNDPEFQDSLEKIKAIAKQVVEVKFGSAVMDW